MPVVIVAIGIAALLGGLMIYWAIAGAIVLSALWGWFITPLFGIPVPPLPMVAGLSMVAKFLTHSQQSTYQDHKTNWESDLVMGLVAPWLTLFVGWLIHLWAGG